MECGGSTRRLTAQRPTTRPAPHRISPRTAPTLLAPPTLFRTARAAASFSELATQRTLAEPRRVRLAFALLVLLVASPARAALPPLAYFGELRGEIALPDHPPIKWSITAAPPEAARQYAVATASADGLTVRAALTADETTGALSWRIEEATLQLATWLPVLATRAAPALSGVAAQGEIRITGQGTFVDNALVGQVTIACHDAILVHAADGWTLTRIGVTGEFAIGPGAEVKSTTPFTLSVGTVSNARFGARNFLVSGTLKNLDEVSVSVARVEIAGGEVEAAPFTASLSPFSINAHLRIKRVGLQDFVALIPSGLAEARGRLDGDLRLGWSEAGGVQIGIGKLALDEVEPTILRLAPSPGFLTSAIPARFSFLPGAVGRWLSLRNQAYDDLRDIELGHSDLAVNSLRIELTPDGDAEGRSARVLVDATPVQPDGAVKQVLFTVNVSGPLSTLLHLGMTQEFSTEIH